MKKYLLITVISFMSLTATAQLNVKSLSMSAAIKKAKEQNKMVMMMISTTWCTPCKAIVKELFPLKEVGDAFNDKLIVVKYEVDKSDPDSLVKRYKIGSYPTFIFLNGDGEEHFRETRAPRTAEMFIQVVNNAIQPENGYAARRKRFETDLSYASTYISFLFEQKMFRPANEAIKELLEKRSVSDNFSTNNIQPYEGWIGNNLNSPIIHYMVNHSEKIIECIGEEKYYGMIRKCVNNSLLSLMGTPQIDKSRFQASLTKINSTPVMASDFTKVFAANFDTFIDKKSVEMMKLAVQNKNNFAWYDLDAMIKLLESSAKTNNQEYKEGLIELYETAISKESNEIQKAVMNYKLKKLKKQ